MGFIEILDTDGNVQLIAPNQIVGINDVGDFRIVYTTIPEWIIMTDLSQYIIRRRANIVRKKLEKRNLMGGIIE